MTTSSRERWGEVCRARASRSREQGQPGVRQRHDLHQARRATTGAGSPRTAVARIAGSVRQRSRTRDGLTRSAGREAAAGADRRGPPRLEAGPHRRRRRPRAARTSRGARAVEVAPRDRRVSPPRPHHPGARPRADRSARRGPHHAPGRRLRRAGKAPKTIRNILSTLHSVCDLAVRRRWRTTNPCRFVDAPQPPETADIRYLTQPELEQRPRSDGIPTASGRASSGRSTSPPR